ncbi:MAG: YfiR family protein [Rhizobacter sp.]|nr:YfiR family protein [Burkholderiales bacterium]
MSLATLLVATAPLVVSAQSAATLPANDVAELIVNIARYSSWPKMVSLKSLTVCYAHGGAAPVMAPIAANDWVVKGMTVNWLAISSPKQIVGCNIVWLNFDVRPSPRAWIAAVTDQPILTLSNYADFAADGGIIGAYRVGPDWRFEVNLEALQRSQINISAVALRLGQKPRSSAALGAPR